MIATIADVKKIVGTQYTDAQIQTMLDITEGDITSVAGDVSYGPKVEKISTCKVYDRQIFFKNTQIKEILEVNGKPYTDKYEILPPQNRCVMMTNLYTYLNSGGINSIFTVKYLSGYEELPADLVMAHALLASDMLISGGGKEISKYKMGPRTVEYSEGSTGGYSKKAQSILNRYKLLIV